MTEQTPAERANLYRIIMLIGYNSRCSANAQNYYYHPCHSEQKQSGEQVKFNCLLIDNRYSEGKLVNTWRKRLAEKFKKNQLNDKNDPVSIDDITAFATETTTLILTKYPIYTPVYENPMNDFSKDMQKK
eukprot:307511_1